MARRKTAPLGQGTPDKAALVIRSVPMGPCTTPSSPGLTDIEPEDTELSAAVRRLEMKRYQQTRHDCDTGVHLGSPNQPRQMRRHIPRVSDIRRRVTLTHSDTDCGRRHVNVGHCRRRHSIHDVDGQKSIVSGLSRIPLDIGHIGRGDEAIDGESVHPNTSCSQSCTSQSSEEEHIIHADPRTDQCHLQQLYISTKTQMLELIEADLKLRLELKSMKEDFLQTLHEFEVFERNSCPSDTARYRTGRLKQPDVMCQRSERVRSRNTIARQEVPDVTAKVHQPCPSLDSEPCVSDSSFSQLVAPHPSMLTAESDSPLSHRDHPLDPIHPPVPHQSLADSGTDITSSNTTSDSVSRCPTTSDATGSSLDPPWTPDSLNMKNLMVSPSYSSRNNLIMLSDSSRKYRRHPRRHLTHRTPCTSVRTLEDMNIASRSVDQCYKMREGPLQSTFLYPHHSTPEKHHTRRRLMLEESYICVAGDVGSTVDLGVKELPQEDSSDIRSDDCNNNSKGRDIPDPPDIPKPSPLDNFFNLNPAVKRRNKRQKSIRRPPLLPLPCSPHGHRTSSSENPNFYFETSSAESTPIAVRSHTWGVNELTSPNYGYEDSGTLGFDSSPTMIARDDSIPGYGRRPSSQTSSNLSSNNLKLEETETKGMLGDFIINLQTLDLTDGGEHFPNLNLVSEEEPDTIHPVTPCDSRKMRRQTGQTELYNVQEPIGLSETDLIESSCCTASKIYCSIEATRNSVPDLSSVSTPPSSYRGNYSSSCTKDSSYKESDGMWSPSKSADSISTGPSLPKVASGVGSTFWDPSAITSSDSYGGFIPPRNSPDNTTHDLSVFTSSTGNSNMLPEVGDQLAILPNVRPPCIGGELASQYSQENPPQTPTRVVSCPTESCDVASSKDSILIEKVLPTPEKTKSGLRRSLSKRFKTLGRTILRRPLKSKNASDGSG